ncbi:hypothetical protein ACMAZE_10015 [Pseudopelagicola sp. nBUS_20]|uniref:hypothetical protein n=1 Tax=Pseudopelagicola sp. nBUS_20 TaxID=3395317 RepID=UPI003EBE8E14
MSENGSNKKIMIAMIAGLAVTIIGFLIFKMSLLVSLVLGAIVYVAISRIKGDTTEEDDDVTSTEPEEKSLANTSQPDTDKSALVEQDLNQKLESEDRTITDEDEAVQADSKPEGGKVRLGTILPGEAGVAGQKGSWRYQK